MNKIIARLPAERDFSGLLEIQGPNGKTVAGPFNLCARADDQLAKAGNNPDRNPLLPFGDMPLGVYRVIQILKTGNGTPYGSEEYGSSGIVLLGARQGDAVLADANGRFGFFIQGGRLSRNGALRPTNGSLRLSDRDMRAFLNVLRPLGEIDCHCVEIKAGGLKRRIPIAPSMAQGRPDPASVRESPSTLARQELTRRSWLRTIILTGASVSVPAALVFTSHSAFADEGGDYKQPDTGPINKTEPPPDENPNAINKTEPPPDENPNAINKTAPPDESPQPQSSPPPQQDQDSQPQAPAPQEQAPQRQTEAPAPQDQSSQQQAPAPQEQAPQQQTEAPVPQDQSSQQQAPAPQEQAPQQQTEAPAPQDQGSQQQAPAPQAQTSQQQSPAPADMQGTAPAEAPAQAPVDKDLRDAVASPPSQPSQSAAPAQSPQNDLVPDLSTAKVTQGGSDTKALDQAVGASGDDSKAPGALTGERASNQARSGFDGASTPGVLDTSTVVIPSSSPVVPDAVANYAKSNPDNPDVQKLAASQRQAAQDQAAAAAAELEYKKVAQTNPNADMSKMINAQAKAKGDQDMVKYETKVIKDKLPAAP